MNKMDIVIVGGGIVGLTMAMLLAPTGLKISLVDAAPPPATDLNQEFDLRVSAITRASENIFQRCHVWTTILNKRAAAYREMCVWDNTGQGRIHFSARDIYEPNLGHIIENSVIIQALTQELKKYSNIKIFYSTKPYDLEITTHAATLKLNNDSEIASELVIGADGANSWVRTHSQISVTSTNYQQLAIVATVKTAKPHCFTARQCFLTSGPLAFLPLADPLYCSIVWSADQLVAERLMALSPDQFNQELSQLMGGELGVCKIVSERLHFPLIKRTAANYVADRVALIGDAIHTIHPLAGQGVNIGLQDALSLADLLIKAQSANKSLADPLTLKAYVRQRKGAILVAQGLMDLFYKLFGNENVSATWLRNQGLNITDRLSFLKRIMMTEAQKTL